MGNPAIEEARKNGTYAVVLAARPYQNDSLVNHGLPQMFTKLGIPVVSETEKYGAIHLNDVLLRILSESYSTAVK